ncbi:MAG: signal peptidase I [Victivallaceae bacterium]
MRDPFFTEDKNNFAPKLKAALLNFFRPGKVQNMSRPHKLLRLLIIGVLTFVVCKFFLMPCVISGASMEPTYFRHGFNFCVITNFTKNPPRRGDVVVASYFEKSYLLKRVIALPGEIISIVNGQVYINQQPLTEDYVKFSSDWNLSPRQVKPGNVYLIGDNRSMPINQHHFGQVPLSALRGKPLW